MARCLMAPIESVKATSMENVSTGVLVLRHIQLRMSKYQLTNNEDLQSIMSNLQPNCCLKVDFQKVDQHTGGKWLIHNTKRHKDNQLQSLKL